MRVYKDRPLAGDADLASIVELDQLADALDLSEDRLTLDELRQSCNYPSFDRTRDIRLWEDPAGDVVGFGFLEPSDHTLWFQVHPQAQHAGVQQHILEWAADRVYDLAREGGGEARLCAWARDEDLGRRRLLEQAGFETERAFLRLSRSVTEPLPEPLPPEGFVLRAVAAGAEAQDWVAVYNDSFVDHWNHDPWTVEIFQHWIDAPHYRPELNLVAVAPNKTFAGFCWCDVELLEQPEGGLQIGWISLLGTRREFRGRGIGRALLLEGMRRMRQVGADIAKLAVDAQSPSDAPRLYAKAGFQREFVWLFYSRRLDADSRKREH